MSRWKSPILLFNEESVGSSVAPNDPINQRTFFAVKRRECGTCLLCKLSTSHYECCATAALSRRIAMASQPSAIFSVSIKAPLWGKNRWFCEQLCQKLNHGYFHVHLIKTLAVFKEDFKSSSRAVIVQFSPWNAKLRCECTALLYVKWLVLFIAWAKPLGHSVIAGVYVGNEARALQCDGMQFCIEYGFSQSSYWGAGRLT